MRVSGRRTWMLVTAVVVALAATVVVMSTVMSTEDDRPAEVVSTPEPDVHPFRNILRIPQTTPSDGPKTIAMELRDDIVYAGYHTDRVAWVTAVGLAGETRWTRQVDSPGLIGGLILVATPAVLVMVIIDPDTYAQHLIGLDLSTGDTRWEADTRDAHFTGSFVLTHGPDGVDEIREVATFEPVSSLPNPKGRYRLLFEETWDPGRVPDEGALRGGMDADPPVNVMLNPNQAENQYVVRTSYVSGDMQVVRLATGEVITEAPYDTGYTVVPIDDTIYVHDKGSSTVTAYAADDLAVVRWRVGVPPAVQAATMWNCGSKMLCVLLQTRSGYHLQVIDARTGQQRWRSDRYGSVVQQAGAYLVALRGDRDDVIDVASGEVVGTMASPVLAYAGDGVLVSYERDEIVAHHPGWAKPVSLGRPPDQSLLTRRCEWGGDVVLCAGETEYYVLRYRG